MTELTMTKAERAAFLADLHVGVLSIERDGAAPLSAPVWYRYQPGGEVEFSFESASEKVALAETVGRATFCVQNEVMPYKYVTVEGPIVVGGTDHDLERDLAHRYLGQEIGDVYLASVADTVSRVVRLRPTRWRTVDYSAMVDRLLGAPTA